jgi:hypothetical protein
MARFVKRAWWSLTCICAAVQMVITLFPATFPIDATGGYFSIALVSGPIIGYLLGPLYGSVSVLLGTFLAAVVDPLATGVFGTLGFLGGFLAGLPPTTGAFVAGLIKKGRRRIVPSVFIVTIVLFLITRIGLLVFSFVWLHIIALFLSLLFLVPQLKNHLESGLNLSPETSYSKAAIAIWLLVFISLMADHIVASVIRAYLFIAVPAEIISIVYFDVIFIYPVERILASIVGGLVTILVGVAVIRANLHLPTHLLKGKEFVSIDSLTEEDLVESRTIEELIPSGEDS